MNKFLTMIMTMFLMLGTLSIPVFAEGEADTETTDTTTESRVTTETEVQYIGFTKEDSNYYVYDGTKEIVAYCLNAHNYAPATLLDGENNPSIESEFYRDMMIFERTDDLNKINSFGIQKNSNLTKGEIVEEVRSILYYGYPYKNKFPVEEKNLQEIIEGLTEQQYRMVTQAVIWKFTDGDQENCSVLEFARNNLHGNWYNDTAIAAYNYFVQAIMSGKLKVNDDNFKLYYYHAGKCPAVTQVQDLLSTEFTVPDSTPSILLVKIHAEKLLDGATPGESDKFTFVLKNGDKVIQEVQNDGSSVDFSFYQYTTDSTTYTVQEKSGNDQTIEYDDSVYEVTVSYVNGEAVVDYPESGITFRNSTKQPEPTTTPEPEITVAKEPEPTQAPEPTVAQVKEEVKEEVVAEETLVVEVPVVATRPYTPNTGDEMEVVKWSKTFTTALALGILNGIILKKYH